MKDDARILDLGSLDEKGIDNFISLFGESAINKFAAYIKQYPPENIKRRMKMAWSIVRETMMMDYGTWNAIMRRAGWDAIFDDTDSVHVEEVQLIVLNPRIIKTIRKETLKSNAFENVTNVINELKPIFSEFGELEIEGPKLTKDRYDRYGKKELISTIRIKNEKKYAWFDIQFDEPNKLVRVGLKYSNPSLGYGVGTQYDTKTKTWAEYVGLDDIKKQLKRILVRRAFDCQKSVKHFRSPVLPEFYR